MRYLFIVNPVAGRGEAYKKWSVIKKEAEEELLDYDVVFTSEPGEGVFLAKAGVAKGFQVLVAVGGDGTINEVIRGIIEAGNSHQVKLGVIAAGTGNDLIRTLGIPADVKKAVQVLKNAREEKIDLGKINGDYFINTVGIGFDGAVAYEINTNVKWLKGTLAYLYGVLKTLIKYRSPKMLIKIDEQIYEGRYFLVAIANGKYYGGGMMIAPDANVTDGLLDIVVIKDLPKLEVLKVFPKIFSGKHIQHSKAEVYRGKKIYLESSERVLIQADGELKGILPMGFSLEQQILSILMPEN